MLASDVTSAVLFGLATSEATSTYGRGPVVPLAVLASVGYLLPSPLVHALHGHGWRAVGSVVLRGALPTAGVFVGAFFGAVSCSGSMCLYEGSVTGAIVGAFVGGLGAAVIDDAVLAWEPPDEPAPARTTLQWLPTLGVAHDSGGNSVPTLGIAGTF